MKVTCNLTFRGSERALLSELVPAVEAFGLEGRFQRRSKQTVRAQRCRAQPDAEQRRNDKENQREWQREVLCPRTSTSCQRLKSSVSVNWSNLASVCMRARVPVQCVAPPLAL